MISDELCDAIQSIEDYQRDLGETYRDLAADIDLVKAVMRSLVDRLDDPFGDEQPRLRDFLSDDQKDMWRVTCEANIARWAERLRLLGPVTSEEILGALDDAIARQEAIWRADQGCRQGDSPVRPRQMGSLDRPEETVT